jgi:hypothetical protein
LPKSAVDKVDAITIYEIILQAAFEVIPQRTLTVTRLLDELNRKAQFGSHLTG